MDHVVVGLWQSLRMAAGGVLSWDGRSRITSPADGQILLTNNAGTNFNRLMFGGTTNSFPALKRVNATLQVRLADDSANADLAASSFFATAIVANSGPASTGFIRMANNAFAVARNAGNTADKSLIGLNASDETLISNDGQLTFIAGPVRIPNNTFLKGRNAGNSADKSLIGLNASDYVSIAADGSGTVFGGGVSFATTSDLWWSGRALFNSPADGKITFYNNAKNDFSMLQFGGLTNAFPALKRSSTTLIVRLADDSGNATLEAAALNASSSISATTNPASTGFLRLASAGTIQARNAANNDNGILLTQNAADVAVLSSVAISLAQDATLKIATAPLGRLVVVNTTSSLVGLFVLKGTGVVTMGVESDAGFSATKDNAGTINVYYSVDGVYIQNKIAGARTVKLQLIGA